MNQTNYLEQLKPSIIRRFKANQSIRFISLELSVSEMEIEQVIRDKLNE